MSPPRSVQPGLEAQLGANLSRSFGAVWAGADHGVGPRRGRTAGGSRQGAVRACRSTTTTHPPRIERGWRHHLIDVDGRGYLDMVNNVAILGHGESRIADAVERQLRLLNTNSRFHYESIVEFSEALAARCPVGLDQVLLVNSGSEAVDLAIRMARAATGRTDVLALAEAYHGWTVGADAISTSIGDNPRALETRPPWVHLLETPNAYRGRWRGADARSYARGGGGADRLARRVRGVARGHRVRADLRQWRRDAAARRVPQGGVRRRARGGRCVRERRGAGGLRSARQALLGLRAAGGACPTSWSWRRRWATGIRSAP